MTPIEIMSHTWMGFTPNTPHPEAEAAFAKKHGCAPETVFDVPNGVYAGPLKGDAVEDAPGQMRLI